MNKFSLIVVLAVLVVGCGKNKDEDRTSQLEMEMPVSTLSYTEFRDDENTIITQNFSSDQNDLFIDIRDSNHDVPSRACTTFSSGLTISNEDYEDPISIAWLSKIDRNLLQPNGKEMKSHADFQKHIYRRPNFTTDKLPCETANNETLLFATKYLMDTNESVVMDSDFSVSKYERKAFLNDGLGYVLLDMELSYVAEHVRDDGGKFYYPVEIKLKHSIPFPEFDL